MLYALFPIAWIISTVVQGAERHRQRPVPADERVDWENYERDPHRQSRSDLFLPALRNSFGICLIATFISCMLAMFAAYAIARLDFPGKRLILSTALAVAIFPVISIVTPLFNLWRQIGLYDTWLGLIIPYLSLTLPISIWTLSAFFRRDPLGDGAGRPGRRRDDVAGVPQGDRAAGRTRASSPRRSSPSSSPGTTSSTASR